MTDQINGTPRCEQFDPDIEWPESWQAKSLPPVASGPISYANSFRIVGWEPGKGFIFQRGWGWPGGDES